MFLTHDYENESVSGTADGNHICKTNKLGQLADLVASIEKRANAWLASQHDDSSAGTASAKIRPLFTEEEVQRSKEHYVPRWPIFVHLAAAIVLMSCSSYYHLFLCENHERCVMLRCMDLSGICIMICGSSTPPMYYGMIMCEESRGYGQFYLIQVWGFCFVAAALTLYNRGNKDSQWVNAIAYIVAGWCTAFGLTHMVCYTDKRLLNYFQVFPWAFGGVLYSVGAIIYALKIPERFVPRTFDNWMNSHTIFHWMILAAAILHVWSSIRVFHER